MIAYITCIFGFLATSLMVASEHGTCGGSLAIVAQNEVATLEDSFFASNDLETDISILQKLVICPGLDSKKLIHYQELLSQKEQLQKELLYKQMKEDFLLTVLDERHDPIIRKFVQDNLFFELALKGSAKGICKMIDDCRGSVYSTVPPIVYMYWVAKYKNHPDIDEITRLNCDYYLHKTYDKCHAYAKKNMPHGKEGYFKYAKFLNLWRQHDLENRAMLPEQFIDIFADEKWIQCMKRHLKKMTPKLLRRAEDGHGPSIFALTEFAKKEEHICTAMYWLYQIIQNKEAQGITKKLARIRLTGLFKKHVWDSGD